MSKSIEEFTIEVEAAISKLHKDLQISSPSSLLGNIFLPKILPPVVDFDKSFSGFTSMITESIEHNKLLAEICMITGKTRDEIIEFVQSHLYSLEDVRDAVMMGYKLKDEE